MFVRFYEKREHGGHGYPVVSVEFARATFAPCFCWRWSILFLVAFVVGKKEVSVDHVHNRAVVVKSAKIYARESIHYHALWTPRGLGRRQACVDTGAWRP